MSGGGRIGVVSAVRLAARGANLGDVWDRLAETYGRRVAFTLEEPLTLRFLHGRELTHEDLAEVVARLAGGLVEAGVQPGERVAVCTANRIDYALTVFAAIRAGAVAVPLHHHLKPAEVDSLVARAKARTLVADPAVAVKRRGLRTLVAGRDGDLDRAAAAAGPIEAVAIDADAPAAILFTSGTTGVPKGATLTSRSLLAVARLAALAPDARNESGVCGLPLAHVMGLSAFLLAALSGAQMHWFGKFEADKVLAAIVDRKATFFVGVPAMYALMAEEELEKWDLSGVKLWASGADAMPGPLRERFRKLGCALRSPLGAPLFTAAFAEVYGMVELSGPAIVRFTPPAPVNPRAAKLPLVGRLAAGETAFGIPIPPYRARVVGDDGKPLKSGQVGELVLKGPGVTKGYDADAAATKRAIRGVLGGARAPRGERAGSAKRDQARNDGWLFTGDLATRNRLGMIAFVTRKKDVIKHGGFSVFPAEVEAQIAAHPAIAEAVVFGLAHPTKGAVPAAAVVLKKGKAATEDELLDWTRENIAPFKAPRALAIVKSADVPRNANRKVLKDELKAKLEKKLAAQLRSRSRSS